MLHSSTVCATCRADVYTNGKLDEIEKEHTTQAMEPTTVEGGDVHKFHGLGKA